MSDPAKNVLLNMVRINLEQGYEMAGADHFDEAVGHFEQAIEQTKQMKELHEQSQQPSEDPDENQPPLIEL